MLRKTIAVGVAVATVLTGATPVFAYANESEAHDKIVNRVVRTVESTVRGAENTAKTTVEATDTTVQDKPGTQREQIEARKAELQEKMSQKVAERKVKLEGRRLAQCQNRQATINKLMDTSVTNGQARLQRIQRFEEGIKKFYTEQALTSESYDAVLLTVDEKEAQAIAVLDTTAAQDFDCTVVDGATPAAELRSLRESKHLALKEYRDSVKELLRVVREAFTQKLEAQG